MPKLFNVLVGIEEIALGRVMRILNNTPGVAKVDLLMDSKSGSPNGDKSASAHTNSANGANGHANGEEKPRKPRFQGEVSGADRLIQLLKRKPMKNSILAKEFEKEGRAPGSVASLLHLAKKGGLVESKEDGYHLTKRGRDKARYV